MKEEEKLTDEQLWQLCLDEEKKTKEKKTRLKNEDESCDWEFWSKEFERTKGLK
jgi:hypothetical protein